MTTPSTISDQDRKLRYTLLAFATAPLVPALALAPGLSYGLDPGGWLAGALLFYMWSLMLSVPLALPLYLLFKVLKLVRWWTASLAGAAVGPIAIAAPFGRMPWMWAIFYGAIGAIAGYVFWRIWSCGQVHPPTSE